MEDALDMAAHSLGPESSGPVADAGQGAASEMGPATSKRKMCARTRHDIHVALGLPASAVRLSTPEKGGSASGADAHKCR